jgi:serine phosphatase RsbU (regulator of sigma subunit)/DNA-binding response OmpR family regulator
MMGEAPVTILVVDDRPGNLVALEAALAPLGHHVLTARSGEEALRHLLTHDVALILLDVKLPGMDGFEIAAHIKQRERTSEIPIIFLTAYSIDAVEAMRGFETGAVDYLTRPIDAWLLRSKARVFVDLYQKTALLRRQREVLALRLDEHYATEARNLRKLADAAVAINSTRSLDDMLEVINDSAREVIGAREAETIVMTGGNQPGRSRTADLSAISSLLWERKRPVRMTRTEIEDALAARGLSGVEQDNPVFEGWLGVPLVGRTGRVLGLIQIADKIRGDFTDSDELVLLQLAQLAAVAIENAQRYEHEHRIAETLQRSLLPDGLPLIEGAELEWYYQPGGADTQAGGDWFDAFLLGGHGGKAGRLALTVGDVVGRGARAAAVMGQLRTAIRAYALHGLTPAELVTRLNQLVAGFGEPVLATAIYGVLDLDKCRLELVNAGHPPPLLVCPGEDPTYISLDPGVPLGVCESYDFTVSTVDLARGALLLLFTDGLVEDRSLPLHEGLARLLEVIDADIKPLSALCHHLIGAMTAKEKGDDVALLALRLNS